MKSNVDKAVAQTPSIEHVIVVQRTGESVEMNDERDLWWQEEMAKADPECPPEETGCGRSIIYFIYIRFHRQAQRRAPHHRRLFGLHIVHS